MADGEQTPLTASLGNEKTMITKKLIFLQPNSTIITPQSGLPCSGLHPSSRTSLSLHLTALRTLLSKGFLLGSLVEDRIPVPQLLARVFLWGRQKDILGEGIRASPGR